jgi:hypothetical protein
MENPFVVLVEAIRAFDALGIDYVVVGSIASSIHGEYRASGDIDIVADIKLHHVEPLVESLKSEFYVDDLTIRRAISEGRSFNIIHLQVVFKIDIFIPATELGTQQLARREQHLLDSTGLHRIWIATAEDTILAKLRYRLGQETSELQWRDVTGIIGARRSRLDQDYLRLWAARLGLTHLLHRGVSRICLAFHEGI